MIQICIDIKIFEAANISLVLQAVLHIAGWAMYRIAYKTYEILTFS